MEISAVLSAIAEGEFDDQLDALVGVVSLRRKSLSVGQALRLYVNDRVRFNRSVKPAYLRGLTGTVVGHQKDRVLVRLDESAGRFQGEVRCPGFILERV